MSVCLEYELPSSKYSFIPFDPCGHSRRLLLYRPQVHRDVLEVLLADLARRGDLDDAIDVEEEDLHVARVGCAVKT